MIDDNTNAAAAANDTPLPADVQTTTPEASPAVAQANLSPEDAMEASLGNLYDKLNEPEKPAQPVEPEEPGEPEQADQPAADELGQPTAATEAPASWSAEMKAEWATLPAKAQSYVLQRERDSMRKISEQGNELGKMRPIVDTAQKFQKNFDRHGVTFEQGMTSLMMAQDMLDRNPLQGLAAIAQTYGVNLAQAFGPAQQAVHPDIQRLIAENQQLKASTTHHQREQLAAQRAEERQLSEWASNEIATWSDGKEHFEAVREDMQVFLKEGRATDLDDAYDKACHANPEIRQKVTAAQRAKEAQAQREAAELAAKDAKRKAQTNTGNRPARPAPSGSILDDDAMSSRFDAIVGAA